MRTAPIIERYLLLYLLACMSLALDAAYMSARYSRCIGLNSAFRFQPQYY
jgi:hypothetical protein